MHCVMLIARSKPVARNRCVIHVMDWLHQCLHNQQISCYFVHVHVCMSIVRVFHTLLFLIVKHLQLMGCISKLHVFVVARVKYYMKSVDIVLTY